MNGFFSLFRHGCGHVLLALSLCLFSGGGVATVLEATDPAQTYSPLAELEMLRAPASLTFAEAAAQPEWHVPSRLEALLHDNRQGLWLRFKLRAANSATWWLIPSWPLLDHLEIRTRDAQGVWSASQQFGLALPGAERRLALRQFAFALPEANQVQEVYLRLDSREGFLLSLKVMSQAALVSANQQETLLIGCFFGSLLTFFLLSCCFWGIGRQQGYAWYAFYLLSVIGYEATITGFGQWLLWPQWPAFAERTHLVFASLCFLSAGLFVRHLLGLYRGRFWIDIGNRLLIGYWGVVLGVTSLWPAALDFPGLLTMMMLSCILLLATATALAMRGSRMARWFAAAWSMLLLGSLAQLLTLGGWLPVAGLGGIGQMIGFAVGFVFLSLGLAERFSRERQARIDAQRQALEASQALAREREGSFVELELRVAMRTVELQQAKNALERLNRELLHQSQTDALTGLGNRRYFERTFQQEIRRSTRAESSLAVLVLDLDHFKAINDVHGHTLGDECLRLVADVLRQHTQRAGELAARYGGEEFVIALPGSDRVAALGVAERIRQDVARQVVQGERGEIRLSVSVGVAVAIPSNLEHGQGLLEEADHALHTAKRGGRDRVCLSEALPGLLGRRP